MYGVRSGVVCVQYYIHQMLVVFLVELVSSHVINMTYSNIALDMI